MDIGDYYSKSFKGFKRNPKLAIPTLVGYILIYVVAIILGLVFIFGLFGPEILRTGQFNINTIDYTYFGALFLLLYGAILIIATLISSYMYAATIGMAKKIIGGERPELNVGLKSGNKYFIKIFLVTIIIGIILAVAAIPFILGLVLDYMYGLLPAFTLTGGLISLIFWAIIITLFIFVYQSIVVGKKSIMGSFKESIKLFRKNIFEVIIVLIINAVILISIGAVLFFINMFLSLIPVIGAILGILIGIIVNALTLPYFTLVLTYLYMDIKAEISVRTEYLD